MSKLTITYSIADQDLYQTKSVGILNLSRRLLHWLVQADAVQAATLLTNRTLADSAPSSPKLESLIDNTALRGKAGRIFWDQWGVYSAASRAANEWLFLPKGFASFIRRPPCKLATCVADDIVCHYAQQYPGYFSKAEELYFIQALRATLRYSKIIFTISEFSRACILGRAKEFGLPPPSVSVCGLGFEHIPTGMKKTSSDVVVLVGKSPHKRSAEAVDYTRRWQEESGFDGRVQFIGSLPDDVLFPAFSNWSLHCRQSDEDFLATMMSAQTLIYFSDYEGFGMPPVEAILQGGSTVYSDIPATREVMEDTGFAFSNNSVDSFVAAMNNSINVTEHTIQDWQSRLRARHSWEKTTNTVVAELEKF